MVKKLFLITLSCLLLTSCGLFQGKPVPKEYLNFVGTWEGNGVQFLVTKDGGVAYQKISGNGSYSINAPLKEINDHVIKIGALFINQDFKVDKPPYIEDEKTKMVIDGDVLVKKEF